MTRSTLRKVSTFVLSALGVAALASGCTGEMPTDEEIASYEQAACSNPDGVYATMAALGVSAARELRRWQPVTDFVFSSGYLKLTTTGKSRCSDKVCANTQAILDMQKPAGKEVVFPGGVTLNPDALRSRLGSFFDRQIICNSRPDNNAGDNCPVEKHDLKFSYAVPGSCDTDFWFHAYKEKTTSPLQYPRQLKNQLIWVGYPENPFLAFDTQGDDVKIDPTGGLCEGYSTYSGSCSNACTKYSKSDISGQCCYCNGRKLRYYRSSFSYYYYSCK